MQCYDKDIVPIAFNMLSCMIFCNLAMQLKWREREEKTNNWVSCKKWFLAKTKVQETI